MNRLWSAVLISVISTVLVPGSVSAVEPVAPRPNVVLVVLDDLTYVGDAFFERLPNFKRLFIDHGLDFIRADGNDPMCCPGRAGILTGQDAHNSGVVRNNARLFDPSVTLATELHDVGYYTGIFGKYLNHSERLADKTPPGWNAVAISAGGYYRFPAWVYGRERSVGDDPVGDYSTDFFARLALDFVAKAPPNHPLFAYLSPFAPHFGSDEQGHSSEFAVAAPRDRGDPRCAGLAPLRSASYNEADVSDKPAWVRRLPRLSGVYGNGYPLVPDCEALLAVDDELGAIADLLVRQGRFDNTLWLLTADNGYSSGAHRWLKKGAPYATQVPLYASWPLRIGPVRAREPMQVSNVDLAPTVCELAGCVMGPFVNGHAVDGRSFAGLLAPTFGASVPQRDAIVLEDRANGRRISPWRSIKTTFQNPLGLWQYVVYPQTGEKELYDISGGPCFYWSAGMSGDPCELNNLAGKPAYAAIESALDRQLKQMW